MNLAEKLSFLAIALMTAGGHFLLIPVWLHMIVVASAVIIIGGQRTDVCTAPDEGAAEEDKIRSEDALWFPIQGSLVLFGIYLAFRFFKKEYVNFVAKFYFYLLGWLAISDYLASTVLAPFVPESWNTQVLVQFNFPSLPLPSWLGGGEASKKDEEPGEEPGEEPDEQEGDGDSEDSTVRRRRKPQGTSTSDDSKDDAGEKEEFDLEITPVMVVGTIIALGFMYWHHTSRHWISYNIQGIIFCLQALRLVPIGQVKAGTILLVGLFVYDIFWVFGTEVMVKVATNLDAPIKLLFPRLDGTPERPNSMLGLGDILVPGLYICVLYAWDVSRHRQRVAMTLLESDDLFESLEEANELLCHDGDKETFRVTESAPKTYFYVTMVAYALSLGLTCFVMYYFKAAQPALLYLVPGCLGASYGLALIRGELTDFWNFDEEKDFLRSVDEDSESQPADSERESLLD